MALTRIRFIDIDSYIGSFPEKTQKLLQAVRETIRKAAPEAEQTINYGIPRARRSQCARGDSKSTEQTGNQC
jgi:uncharacterized protein YdhG (YjbR/CyaY superfamily)